MRTLSLNERTLPSESRVSHSAVPIYSISRPPAIPPKKTGFDSRWMLPGVTSWKEFVAEWVHPLSRIAELAWGQLVATMEKASLFE